MTKINDIIRELIYNELYIAQLSDNANFPSLIQTVAVLNCSKLAQNRAERIGTSPKMNFCMNGSYLKKYLRTGKKS